MAEPSNRPPAAHRAPATGVVGRVLVAEDDTLTSDYLKTLLRSRGHEVEVVTQGEAALERLARGGIDVALIDATLPRIPGVELCRLARGMAQVSFLPMVLLASRTDGSLRVDGMRVGVDDWIGKPLDEPEVIARVDAMMRMKRLHDQVAAARAQLEELTSHDELTGLHSFRHASARLGDEFRRSERYHDPLACLMIDIDGLRHWNEAYGRVFGDELVRSIGRMLRSALRDVDLVARYGGDEFLAILPSTHFAGALSASDRVCRGVRAMNRTAPDGGSVHVTLSIGVSLFPSRDVRTKDQLLRAAEASLLRSKRDGGDRICVFQHQGYIYSPDTDDRAEPPPHGGSNPPKPPSNSGIVAARKIPAPESNRPTAAGHDTASGSGDRRRGPSRGET